MSQAPATAAAVESVNPADADPSATTATAELPAWLETGCRQLTEWLPNLLPPDRCDDLYVGLLVDAIWHLPAALLLFLSVLWGLVRWLGGGNRRQRAPVTQGRFDSASDRRSPIGWLMDQLLARRRERRYMQRLAARNAELTVLRRAVPLRLQDIYVGLKVAEHQSPRDRLDPAPPDDPGALLAASGRTLTLPQALGTSRRLLVLGEPGAGKSTLMRFLVLAMAKRDPRFGAFARALVPNRSANALERLRRRLHGTNLVILRLPFELAALLACVIGIFVSAAPLTHLLLALSLFLAHYLVFSRPWHQRWLGWTLALAVLGYAWLGSTPVWSIAALATSASVAVLLFPFLVVGPVALLRRLAHWRTRYPLPVLLTLNDLTAAGGPIEDQMAAALAEIGALPLCAASRLLRRRLRAGACLLLLDGLDEVTEPAAGPARIGRQPAAAGAHRAHL